MVVRRLTVVLVLLVGAVGLAACGGGSSSSGGSGGSGNTEDAAGAVTLGGILTAARGADVQVWDPAQINDNDSLWAAFQTNANLIMASPDGKSLEPYVAKSWEVSPDGLTYTFVIDPAAKFCDGSQITAEDVVYSFNRAKNKDAVVSWQYPAGMEVSAPDPGTAVITLPEANVSFLSYLTLWGTAIVSKQYGEQVGDTGLAEKPLGSGPFCLKSWERGSQITLVRNENFWLKDKDGNRLPYLDEIDWKIVKDDNARLAELQSGQLDVATVLAPSQFASLEGAPGIVTGESPLLGTISLFTNLKVPALADKNVRQALNYATDKQAIIDGVLFGKGKPAMSTLFLANFTNEAYGYPYDLDKAKELMASSGFANGFPVTVTYVGGDSVAEQTLTILKDEWAKIGVDLKLKAIEEGVYFDTWSSGDWELIWVKATNDIYDPAENLHFNMMGEEGGSNSGFTGYTDPNLNKLVLAAEKETDETKRADLYDQIQKIYMADGPQVYLFHPEALWATSDKVGGFEIYKTGLHPFWYTYLKQ